MSSSNVAAALQPRIIKFCLAVVQERDDTASPSRHTAVGGGDQEKIVAVCGCVGSQTPPPTPSPSYSSFVPWKQQYALPRGRERLFCLSSCFICIATCDVGISITIL